MAVCNEQWNNLENICYSIYILDALAWTSKNSNDSLMASSFFSSDISARASWSSLLKYNLWMEVYNICSFSYVGSLRDGYFWVVFGYFARLVSRSIVTNRKNFQRPGWLRNLLQNLNGAFSERKKRKSPVARKKNKTLWRKREGNWFPFFWNILRSCRSWKLSGKVSKVWRKEWRKFSCTALNSSANY